MKALNTLMYKGAILTPKYQNDAALAIDDIRHLLRDDEFYSLAMAWHHMFIDSDRGTTEWFKTCDSILTRLNVIKR